MNVVFMGTPRAAAVSLQRLIRDGHNVVAVYTQPDRPAGRGGKLARSPVKEVALEYSLPVHQPTKIKTSEALDVFRRHDADAAIVVAYGRILPPGFLNAYHHGALNVHFSLLPKYRGAAPVNWAIISGETETGVTVMQMDEGLDTGDILEQRSTRIGRDETAVGLMDRLSLIGADLISETISHIETINPVKQNNAEATYAPILKKEDGLIDWKMSATDIERRVRGFQPFPTSYTFYSDTRLTIWKANMATSDISASVGTVINADKNELSVCCGSGTVLKIIELQPEGKRRMLFRDFLNGAKLKPGDQFGPSIRAEGSTPSA